MRASTGVVFESFVNSERCKTLGPVVVARCCLRALLIQKDVKRYEVFETLTQRLRALLIQKDVKLLSFVKLPGAV